MRYIGRYVDLVTTEKTLVIITLDIIVKYSLFLILLFISFRIFLLDYLDALL